MIKKINTKDGFIYLIHRSDSKEYKIGKINPFYIDKQTNTIKSNNKTPIKRLKELQTGNAEKLILVTWFYSFDTKIDEYRILKNTLKYKTSSRNEWRNFKDLDENKIPKIFKQTLYYTMESQIYNFICLKFNSVLQAYNLNNYKIICTRNLKTITNFPFNIIEQILYVKNIKDNIIVKDLQFLSNSINKCLYLNYEYFFEYLKQFDNKLLLANKFLPSIDPLDNIQNIIYQASLMFEEFY